MARILMGIALLMAGGIRADQVRVDGTIREGTIHPISDESTIYFLENGGRHYVALRRDQVEVLASPGISNADQILKRSQELVQEGRTLLNRRDYGEASTRFEQADRLLRVIRKPAGKTYAEAQSELARIQNFRQFVRDLEQAEISYSNALQAIENALQFQQTGRRDEVAAHLAEADAQWARIQVGPRLESARKGRASLERLKTVLEKHPEWFTWPAQYAAADYHRYDESALHAVSSNVLALTEEVKRQQTVGPDLKLWLSGPLAALQSAQEKIQEAIGTAREREIRCQEEAEHLRQQLQATLIPTPAGTLDEWESRIREYERLAPALQRLAGVPWSGPAWAEGEWTRLQAAQREARGALAAQQAAAGWIYSPADARFHPPTPEGVRALLEAYRQGRLFVEGDALLREVKRTTPHLILANSEGVGAFYREWGDEEVRHKNYFAACDRYGSARVYLRDRKALETIRILRKKALILAWFPFGVGGILVLGIGMGLLLAYCRPIRVVRRFRADLDGRRKLTIRQAERRVLRLEKLHHANRLPPEGMEVWARLLVYAAEESYARDEVQQGEAFFARANQVGWTDRSRFLARVLHRPSETWRDERAWTDRVWEYFSLPLSGGESAPPVPVLLAEMERRARIERTAEASGIAARMELNQRLVLLPWRVPELIVVEGPGKGSHYPVGPRMEIGSDKGCAVRMDDPGVAPHHAVIGVQDGVALLSPSSAQAPVLHQGQRVEHPVALNDGDRVCIGLRAMIYYVQPRPVDHPLVWAYYHQGVGYFIRRSWGDAMECLEMGRNLDWSHAATHLLLGEVHERRGEVDAAIAAGRAAAEMDGRNADAWALLARLYLAKSRTDHAARNLQDAFQSVVHALQASPERADLHFLQATLWHAQGRDPEAMAAMETVRRLDPTGTEYRSLWACLKWSLRTQTESDGKAVLPEGVLVLVVDPGECLEPGYSRDLSDGVMTSHRVASASDAEEVLLHRIPAALIVEMDLPDQTGVAFCRKIRRQKTLAQLPLILVTSRTDDTLGEEGREAGADEVLVKPFDPQLLKLKIQRLLPDSALRDARVEGVKGRLREMNFPELVQVLCSGGKSVVIDITSPAGRVEVFVRDGEIIHARSSSHQGEEAFYEVMAWKDGDFIIRPAVDFPERTIHASSMGLLMEGARRGDESRPA